MADLRDPPGAELVLLDLVLVLGLGIVGAWPDLLLVVLTLVPVPAVLPVVFLLLLLVGFGCDSSLDVDCSLSELTVSATLSSSFLLLL